MLKFKKKKSCYASFLNVIITIWALLMECNPLFTFLFLLWINMMLYCLNNINNRILLFCFGISCFVFLIGRDTLENFIAHEIETPFANSINNHAYYSIILALLGTWITFALFNQKNALQYLKKNVDHSEHSYYYYVRICSKWCFIFTYPFAILLNIGISIFIARYGYYSYYTDLSGIMDSSPILYLLSKIEITMPAAFAIYISTLPSKKEFKGLAIPYLIYLIITLGCGQRGTFLLGILLFIIFLMYMQQLQPNIIWIKKSHIRTLIVTIPLIAIGSTFYNNLRFEKSNSELSAVNGFTDFFYNQGVSINIIKRAYEYESSIPKQKDFYTFEFLHSGIPARIVGNEVYHGNTIEHATKGGSFIHALGYTMMGKMYLAGGGTGSSYIAELYYDFGYLGIFLGSCLYGYIFTLINNLKSNSLFSRSLIFIVITQLLWAPRASYSAFLSFIFAPTTIALLVFVFAGAQILYVQHKKSLAKSQQLLKI